jgi:serine/threonine protein kinase
MLREARALAALSHDNVLVVHDAGEVDDEVFIAMELVDGVTLADWLAEPRSIAAILEVVLAAGRGLAAAHQAGIVHRDFKPQNVIVGKGRVRVADFALARAAGDELADPIDPAGTTEPGGPPASITRTGAVMGTPAYMSPEQHGGQPADARSDQFSFCVVLYRAGDGDRAPMRRRVDVGAALRRGRRRIARTPTAADAVDRISDAER